MDALRKEEFYTTDDIYALPDGERAELIDGLIRELISPHLNGLFVTPKDIDETVKRISYTISESLNMLFSEGHAHNQ